MQNKPNVVSHIYEHPFGERTKLLLRLEIIFAQALKSRRARDKYETQMCLDALFALLNLTNRYELRSELLKELERVKNMLTQLKQLETVNVINVDGTLLELNQCAEILHDLDSKHIDRIRNIEFLNKIKLRNIHETGNYLFEVPQLQHWLLQSAEHREAQIAVWLDDFAPFKRTIDYLLRIIRDSAEPEKLSVDNGVYIKRQDNRGASHQQLLRIRIEAGQDVYPSVSGNDYRFAIRFMQQQHVDERAEQIKETVHFELSCCGL